MTLKEGKISISSRKGAKKEKLGGLRWFEMFKLKAYINPGQLLQKGEGSERKVEGGPVRARMNVGGKKAGHGNTGGKRGPSGSLNPRKGGTPGGS